MGKLVRSGILILFWVCIPTTPSWAAGPHGSGEIGSKVEWIELPRGFLAYQNFTAPVFYPSMTRRDILPMSAEKEVVEVEGISSKTRIFLPLGLFFGLSPTTGASIDLMDRGVIKAIQNAKERFGVQTLYDVRIDKRLFSIIGIYTKTTTIIHAKGLR